jgi:putative nucleotidyltransferase with HDIG domain
MEIELSHPTDHVENRQLDLNRYDMNHSPDELQKIERIIHLVNRSEIASIKSVVSGIIRVINDPESTANDLIDVIETDPPLTGKVLKVANSAYYSPLNRIGDIRHAVVWIGLDTLKELALNQKIGHIFNGNGKINGYSRQLLWKHSVTVAKLSKMIFRKEFGESGANAYVAGLLHDIGIIVEDQYLPTDFNSILKRIASEDRNLSILEREVFGFDHAYLGMALADNWNLPQELVFAIGCHDKPIGVDPDFARLASTLHIAEIFSKKCYNGYMDITVEDDRLFNKCLTDLEVEIHAIELIAEEVKQELSKMEEQGLF